MNYTIWQLIIFVIAFGMILLSVLSVVLPQKLIKQMPIFVHSKMTKYSDIAIRLLLGISLIMSASTAVYPIVFTVFGYVSLMAVVAIIMLGTRKLAHLINYIAGIFPVWAVRLVCSFSIILFTFLIFNIG